MSNAGQHDVFDTLRTMDLAHAVFAWAAQHWRALLVLGLTVLAFLLRLHELGAPTLTHYETYVPGLNLPDGISEPPSRHTLGELLHFHYHRDPHPLGWYLAMHLWQGIAGETEWVCACRLSCLEWRACRSCIFLASARIPNRPGLSLLQ